MRVVAHGEVIAAHPRVFGRDQLICDPWHYLPVLEKKPGALRNGAPFVAWDLPKPIQLVRERIVKQPRGDRAFVELLMLAGRRSGARCAHGCVRVGAGRWRRQCTRRDE